MPTTQLTIASPAEALGVAEPMNVVVADAEHTDLAEIIDLDTRVTGIARPEFWNDFCHQRSTSETLCLLVAKKSGEIVGYAMGEVRAWPVRAPACGWLYAIGVKAEHRLSRAATALMTELTARFRARGVLAIRTMINIDDHLLMSFLRSLGMTAGPFIELEMKIE